MEKYFKIECSGEPFRRLDFEIESYLNELYYGKGIFKVTEIQPHCGHPVSAIVGSDEETNYCRMCEEEAKAERGLVCPVCKFPVEDADY